MKLPIKPLSQYNLEQLSYIYNRVQHIRAGSSTTTNRDTLVYVDVCDRRLTTRQIEQEINKRIGL